MNTKFCERIALKTIVEPILRTMPGAGRGTLKGLAMKRAVLATLVLLLAWAGCTGPAKPPTTPAMEQPQAMAEMQKLGGQITVDKNAPGQPVTAVNLSDVAITDATLVCLDSFPHLQKLDLGHTKKLRQSTITDAGLVHVAGLKELRRLSLTSTDVTDAGLIYLKGLTRLESLNLEETKVTDAGLKDLAGLSKLQTLKLQGTAVTSAGVRELRRMLPGCKITF
jgi:hypothetical protein